MSGFPNMASSVLPCTDNFSTRAQFRLSLLHPVNMTAISNTPPNGWFVLIKEKTKNICGNSKRKNDLLNKCQKLKSKNKKQKNKKQKSVYFYNFYFKQFFLFWKCGFKKI